MCLPCVLGEQKKNFDHQVKIAFLFVLKDRITCKYFSWWRKKLPPHLFSFSDNKLLSYLFKGKNILFKFHECCILNLPDTFYHKLNFFNVKILFASYFLKVRVDSGIQQGSDISIYYDPMISKVS